MPQLMQASTPEQHALYRAGLCVGCGTKPYSAGRPRCDDCHQDHLDELGKEQP